MLGFILQKSQKKQSGTNGHIPTESDKKNVCLTQSHSSSPIKDSSPNSPSTFVPDDDEKTYTFSNSRCGGGHSGD
jgi:hypothetical protein